MRGNPVKTVDLGWHSDSSESESSLQAGLPVLSLSVGDSATFSIDPSAEQWGDRVVRSCLTRVCPSRIYCGVLVRGFSTVATYIFPLLLLFLLLLLLFAHVLLD